MVDEEVVVSAIDDLLIVDEMVVFAVHDHFMVDEMVMATVHDHLMVDEMVVTAVHDHAIVVDDYPKNDLLAYPSLIPSLPPAKARRRNSVVEQDIRPLPRSLPGL